jgi:hypothetical protein
MKEPDKQRAAMSELDKHEAVMAQIYVAFGQGTGEIRVAKEACLAVRAQVISQLDTMVVNWDAEAVQILERVRAVGRAARQRAVMRYDTVVLAQDVDLVAPQVRSVSGTALCAPSSEK